MPLSHRQRLPAQAPPPFAPPYCPDFHFATVEFLRQACYLQIYLWLRDGQNFWFFPTAVTQQTLEGYYWNVDRWRYTALELSRLDSFL